MAQPVRATAGRRFAVILPSSVSWLPKALPTSESLKRRCWHLPICPIWCTRSRPNLLEQRLNEKIGEIDSRTLAKEDEDLKRPGVGPLTASAAPPMENCRSGRDFAAWLTPREDSTEVRLGRITKSSGELSAPCRSFGTTWRSEGLVASQDAQASEAGGVALANKMARTAWALLTKKEFYQGWRPRWLPTEGFPGIRRRLRMTSGM